MNLTADRASMLNLAVLEVDKLIVHVKQVKQLIKTSSTAERHSVLAVKRIVFKNQTFQILKSFYCSIVDDKW